MRIILYFIAGLVSSTAFAPFEFWSSAFIGLGLWFYLLDKSRPTARFIGSYVYGLGLLLPAQHWTGIYVGNLPWIVLCLVQSIFFIVPAFFFANGIRLKPYFFASSYVLVELLLRTIPFTGFGWSRMSYTQTQSPFSILYPLGGVVLVAWVLAFSVAIRRLSALILVVTLISLAAIVPSQITNSGKIKVALIQGGVNKLGLDFNSKPREVFFRHLDQTNRLTEAVDLIIWPENAVDIDVNQNPDIKKLITDISVAKGTPILVGGVTNSPKGLKNQSMFFTPILSQTYTKRYLTPFGEYLPIRSVAMRVSAYAKQIDDFTAGEQSQTFLFRLGDFQTLICYELINDRFRDEISSNFLVIQTNNATFGDTAQLDQELNIAKVRALETGRNIAYVSTTGVTSLLSNGGKVLKTVEKFKKTELIGEIDLVEGKTLAQRYGFLLEPFFLLTLLLMKFRRIRS